MDRGEFDKMQWQTLPGDALGVPLMHTKELLEAAGPQWLTEAFHAAGSLPKDNAVVAIRNMVRRPPSCRQLDSMHRKWYGVKAQRPCSKKCRSDGSGCSPVRHLHGETG